MATFFRNITKTAFVRIKDFGVDFVVGFTEEITSNMTSSKSAGANVDAILQVPRAGAVAKLTTTGLVSPAMVKMIVDATPNLLV